MHLLGFVPETERSAAHKASVLIPAVQAVGIVMQR